MLRILSLPLILMLLGGCATHPTLATKHLKKGDKASGYTFSVENVFPYYWVQYGISDATSLGFRIGLPIYGSGMDYSRVLWAKENKWDLLNVAWSLNHNSNLDLTYYKFTTRIRKSRKGTSRSTSWWGIRGMYIPLGIGGNSSARLGILLGGTTGERICYELGYYHDFSSLPITDLFNLNWKWDSAENQLRYGDRPHVDASGMPSEFSRLTGLSLKISWLVVKNPEPGPVEKK